MKITNQLRRDLAQDDVGGVLTADQLDYADLPEGTIVLPSGDRPIDVTALQYLRNQWHQVGRINPIGNILQYAYDYDDLFTLVWLP